VTVEIPMDLASYVTVPGIIILAVFVGLWARDALKDSRWVPWLVLGICEAVAVGIRLIITPGPSAAQVALAVLLAFLGVTIETFGYEGITNALGQLGVGRRSDQARLEAAKANVVEAAPLSKVGVLTTMLASIKTE